MSDDVSTDSGGSDSYSSNAGKGDKFRPVRKSRYDQNYDKINWSKCYAHAIEWYVYILECSDKTLYCGITNDLKNRIKVHNERRGAKYTSGRTPVVLVYSEGCSTKSDALKRELQIKKMKKAGKQCLINGYRDRENLSMEKTTDL